MYIITLSTIQGKEVETVKVHSMKFFEKKMEWKKHKT